MIFVGFLLCVIGAILVLLEEALGLPGALNHLTHPVHPDIAPLINLLFLIVLAIISIILALRMRAVRGSYFPLLLIIVAVIIIYRTGFSLIPLIGCILMIIGAILALTARN